MSKLSRGEREFVSGLGALAPSGRPALPSSTAPAPPGGAQEIDGRDLNAPLPLLRAYQALRSLEPGQELRVISSDPGSIAEFQSLAKHVTNFELLTQDVVGEDYVHVLRRRR